MVENILVREVVIFLRSIPPQVVTLLLILLLLRATVYLRLMTKTAKVRYYIYCKYKFRRFYQTVFLLSNLHVLNLCSDTFLSSVVVDACC